LLVQITAVAEMIRELGLKNVEARHTRAEEVTERFDYITGRSVTAMPRFIGWVRGKLLLDALPGAPLETGVLYIRGGVGQDQDAAAEVDEETGLPIPEPAGVYPLTDLIQGGLYDGDKVVLHYAAADLFEYFQQADDVLAARRAQEQGIAAGESRVFKEDYGGREYRERETRPRGWSEGRPGNPRRSNSNPYGGRSGPPRRNGG
jgi:hypothetical protein